MSDSSTAHYSRAEDASSTGIPTHGADPLKRPCDYAGFFVLMNP